MQKMSQPPMRNTSKSAGTMQSKVAAPKSSGSIGNMPDKVVGAKPGSSIPGFSGGIKPGKC